MTWKTSIAYKPPCSANQLRLPLCAMQANANDADGGVLVGNWSGDYNGGRSPTSWNGSVAMLEEYMVTRKSVKFAQCWVFSGLITTCELWLGY